MATKKKLHIEYFIKASPEMLYQYISTPSGLSEWFCDVASARGQNYTFAWTGGGEENAKMIARRQDSLVRFRWEEDAGSSYYFEMAINQDELTGDVLLSVTDFVYKGDEDSAIQMWNASIQNLKTLLGA